MLLFVSVNLNKITEKRVLNSTRVGCHNNTNWADCHCLITYYRPT